MLLYFKYTKLINIAKTIVTNNVFGQKVKPPQQQNTKWNIQILASVGNRTWDLTDGGWVTFGLPSQLKVSIVVKLFNCFNASGRNVNKQNRSHIFNIVIVSVIFKHTCTWITTFRRLLYLPEKVSGNKYRHIISNYHNSYLP